MANLKELAKKIKIVDRNFGPIRTDSVGRQTKKGFKKGIRFTLKGAKGKLKEKSGGEGGIFIPESFYRR